MKDNILGSSPNGLSPPDNTSPSGGYGDFPASKASPKRKVPTQIERDFFLSLIRVRLGSHFKFGLVPHSVRMGVLHGNMYYSTFFNLTIHGNTHLYFYFLQRI